ncbi:1-aminocyclopropane-1-carboxylate deaminase/D-cysteine desulfhydrase [Croceitalea rosinachiae]|uniref:Pyridoxal-phosphate dependent enzyme n=1 Tax=Croceitalea rosinachiae TaxID=3075596 RepID=A0ABU3A9I1_9FLAO|nr:pyridoxal-phosphate dependent enzyme [Croceitalea sp. F388]MDT0606829.1 pyridoxal-phosphate dependent enzyme [Croceitalea sp. F388]
MKVANQEIKLPLLHQKKIELFVKREDLIHPQISGNKYRKLKYNLAEAQHRGFKTLLTFGGAFSNHIAATAYAGKLYGLKTIGVIRGEELERKWKDNPTLRLAYENGMQLHFVSRANYQLKKSSGFLDGLKSKFGSFYIIPEGGTNLLAIKGCEEILNKADAHFDVVCCCVGTGGTLAGLVNSSASHQRVLGFPALKVDFLSNDIRKFAQNENWELISDYHFGGYAKCNIELVRFINDFKNNTDIALDPIYTGKLFFGLLDLIKKDYFKAKTRVLVIHTGGLQGIKGMNSVLKKKDLPLLDI